MHLPLFSLQFDNAALQRCLHCPLLDREDPLRYEGYYCMDYKVKIDIEPNAVTASNDG